ncbi:MAG: hypothetical protein JXA90_04590, partial [Planctomycetes bacterium]|nr:hypothetical protein [Planctomycetota bacterium]
MHRKALVASIAGVMIFCGLCAAEESASAGSKEPVLRRSEVVFMYAASPEAYKAYGATFVAWGGANTAEQVKMHRDLGIRCTGSVWCLTAGAKTLHESRELREAVAVDIEGKPIAVPWQFDKVHEGQTTDFGNTNHPAFREHVKANVRRVMAGGADGLHVDDHLGVASPAHWYGGGFDDHSVAGFREYLKTHAAKEQLASAGIEDLAAFDYRDLVREHARTRDEVKRKAREIPLFDLWKEFHLDAAADFVEELRKVAEGAAGHPVLLSANACLGNDVHHHVVPRLTHVVCEVWFDAHKGTSSLQGALKAFDAAQRLERPLACTASGHDWAHVKARSACEIARFWIALTYAHGQRFMVPHPTRQWCFTSELGTHWYQAPVEEFAPLYRFIREQASLLDGFDAAPDVEVSAPATVMARARRRGGALVIHLVNLDYDAAADRMRPARDVRVAFPASAVKGRRKARYLGCDSEVRELAVDVEGAEASITAPELRLWSLLA